MITVHDLEVRAGARLLMEHVSFRVAAGDKVGLVGRNGAGKTTMTRILAGEGLPAGGSVQWTGQIGYLPQDGELFAGTVAQNIARFRTEDDPDLVIQAATLAGVHELILSLPQGYETPIGEGGTALSAGQRQRVGLARALYGNPFLVVLDEPNSNLDLEGEQALITAMMQAQREFMGGR